MIMKKRFARALSAVLAAVLVLSLSGCGPLRIILDAVGSDPTPAPTPVSTPAPESTPTPEPASAPADDTSTPADTEPSSEEAPSGLYATVEEFLADPAVKAQLDQSIDQMVGGSDDMTVSIEGTRDTLIYMFKYSDAAIAGIDEDALSSTLYESMDDPSFASVFESIAGSVASVVEADTVYVMVIYAKEDGTVLASRDYTSD